MCNMLLRSILLEQQPRKMWQRTVTIFLSSLMVTTSAEERESVCSVVNVVKSHANTLEKFREDHAGQATSIEHRACETFQQEYMDYEPSGTTPIRCEPEVPSKGTIDSLRTLPVEALLEEFRENNSYESS
ncbi:125 kDa kinesin-like protein, partial [Trifolium medium]|nr:125 kDa kinesin-like protein [Trifolium medium]